MTLLQRIADRLILCPSAHAIDPETRQRALIPFAGGSIEAWITRTASDPPQPIEYIAIKFPGSGGRAERSGPHPCELWNRAAAEIWTINNRGYGGSKGRASLQNFTETADAAWNHVREIFPSQKMLVVGNSLGCISALYLAAKYPLNWLYLRNPVPIHQLIATRPKYNWWNLGLARTLARCIPALLDAIGNARQSRCPALFVVSEKDRVVPVRYQQQIVDHYAGPKQVFSIANADHHDRIPEEQHEQYKQAVLWLFNAQNNSLPTERCQKSD
jgi:pimeloyl-ACP methyl ester carboxylesterase